MADVAVSGGAVALGVLAGLLGYVAQAMAWNAALREANGERPSLGAFFTGRFLWVAVLTGVVLSIVSGLIGWIPFAGLAWAIFTVFAIAFVLDHGRGVFEAIGESFRLVAANFGPVFLLLLALLGINILGAIPAGLGLLVTLPVSVLALAYAFRRLTGGTIV